MRRQTVWVIEIDLPLCVNRFGEAPCTAALGGDVARKCFNTRASCVDPVNFSEGVTTLRLCSQIEGAAAEYAAIPAIMGVKVSPAQLNIGGLDKRLRVMGKRETVTVDLADVLDNDRWADPYVDERRSGAAQLGPGYDPRTRGTLLTKLLARNPNHHGWPVRAYVGELGQPLAEMAVRHYETETFTYPKDGRGSMKAADPTGLHDNDQAQFPQTSPGILAADMFVSDTEVRIANAEVTDYPAPGIVRIDDEGIGFTTVTQSGTEVILSGLTRGEFDTDVEDHDVEAPVQLTEYFLDRPLWEVLERIMLAGAQVPPAWVNAGGSWETEWSSYQSSYRVTRWLFEPEGVNTLLGVILEQFASVMWWDPPSQQFRYQAIRFPESTPEVIDAEATAIATGSTKILDELRVNQVVVLYGLKDQSADRKKTASYRGLRALVQGQDLYGDLRVYTIYGDFITSEIVALDAAARILARYRTPPKEVQITVDGAAFRPSLADPVTYRGREIVDMTGLASDEAMQVMSVRDDYKMGRRVITLMSTNLEPEASVFRVSDGSGVTYATATPAQRATLGFLTDEAGNVPGGGRGAVLI